MLRRRADPPPPEHPILAALAAWTRNRASRAAAERLGGAIRAEMVQAGCTNAELEAVCQYLRGPIMGHRVLR